MNEKIKIFISYGVTNANREIPDLISSDFRRLVNLWGATNIEITFDRDFLRGGDKWDTKIKQELESSNVIFFLINEKFLSSEYIANVEFKNTLTRDNIIILHAKLFQCEDYEQLNHIQAINLCNLPFFDFKEDEYRDSSRNRFEISKIASCLFSEVITNFPIAPPPNIILLSSAEIIKQKVNRKEELSDFEFITNRANSPNCSLFIYSATKHDIPNNFNYRTDEIIGNNPTMLSIREEISINLELFRNADNDLDFFSNFIREVQKIFSPRKEIETIFSSVEHAEKLLFELLEKHKIKRLIVPFKFEDLYSNDEKYVNCFMKLLSLLPFDRNNYSGIYLYFLIQIQDPNIVNSILFKAIQKKYGIKNYSTLKDITERDIDKWCELVVPDEIDRQEEVKNRLLYYLTMNQKTLPTKLFYLRKPMENTLKDFNL